MNGQQRHGTTMSAAGAVSDEVAAALRSAVPAVRAAAVGTVVLADGFSCRTQLEQLADHPSVHLAELLAAHLTSLDQQPPR